MEADPDDVERIVLVRVLRLNAVVQGLVTGTVAGLGLFVATNWLVLKGGPVVGPHLALLGQFLPGYRVSFAGSLIGFAWALAIGFVVGALVSALYNRVATRRERGRRP